MFLDQWVAALLLPLAIWVLINGIDDVFIDVVAALSYWNLAIPSETAIHAVPERHMAVFVALWKEHRVIQKMIQNNVRRLNYDKVDFFIGVYPNDGATIAAVKEAASSFTNVHYAITPHDGPTSKADNLNWIYQRMLLYEEEHGVRFEMILTHDAEDLMDPEALRWINYFAQSYDMVQIPVLALPTPFRELSHGVYCDEFAEFQYKDMPARQFLGGFIPSNGVGTGFSRRALEALAKAHSDRIFEPACLTEDYENGFRMRRLGFGQKFIPITIRYGRPIATREYFPRTFQTAVRQRSRWVTGIALQSWEFHSAAETLQHLYWFWRDRKSLITNLLTPITNLLFFYGIFTWGESRVMHHPWALALLTSHMAPLCAAGLSIQTLQTSIRAYCSAKIYGARYAAGVPVRMMVGNWINFFATWRAIGNYTNARLRKRPLRWAKTDHNYPKLGSLLPPRRPLGQLLVGARSITEEQLRIALAEKPASIRLGEYLMERGWLTESALYAALSLQFDLPFGKPHQDDVVPAVTRSLPVKLVKKWKLLPFRISGGEMFIAAAELPKDEMHEDIRRFSSLELRFHLVTPDDFRDLQQRYL